MMRQGGAGRAISRSSEAAQAANDAQKDRAILSFTLLLIGLLALFAGSLTFAVPNDVLYGSTTVQP